MEANTVLSLLIGDVVGREGRQRGGELAQSGYSATFLRGLVPVLKEMGFPARIVELTPACTVPGADDACVLVVRFAKQFSEPVIEELRTQHYTPFVWNRRTKRVDQARSRHIFFVGPEAVEEDRSTGARRVVTWDHLPASKLVYRMLMSILEEKVPFCGAAIKYHDVNKSGIGWHGDQERRKTIVMRLGAASSRAPLFFAWFFRHEIVSEPVGVHLEHGDVVVYSEKSVGCDTKMSSIPTVRHGMGYLSRGGAVPVHERAEKRERAAKRARKE
jgi:hypothetical protein